MKILVDRELIQEAKRVLLEAYRDYGNEDVFNLSQLMCIILNDNPELKVCCDCGVEIVSPLTYPLSINNEYYGILCNECLSKKLNSNTTLIKQGV